MPKLDAKELTALQSKAQSHVQLGALYIHHKGGYYIPKLVSLREDDLEPLVSYTSIRNEDVTFTRPLYQWVEKFSKAVTPALRFPHQG